MTDQNRRASERQVEIMEETEDYNYRDKFRVYRARLRYRRQNGSMSEPSTRLNWSRGNAAAVLLYDPQADSVVLVRQFRYPVYASLDHGGATASDGRGAWLLEIIAGVEEQGQSAEETVRREAEEEAGYRISGPLDRVADVYTTPGSSSERVAIFLGIIDAGVRSGQGGGLAGEGEDTEWVQIPRAEALAMLQRGEIYDAKTVIALQYLALQHAR